MKSNRFWICCIAVLLLVSMIASVAIFRFADTGSTVEIYQQGTLVEVIHLDTVITAFEFTLSNDSGGYNTFTVEHGRICVSDASCPDHVCIKTGWISDGVIPIVCLPNELVIQIKSSGQELDGAAG